MSLKMCLPYNIRYGKYADEKNVYDSAVVSTKKAFDGTASYVLNTNKANSTLLYNLINDRSKMLMRVWYKVYSRKLAT